MNMYFFDFERKSIFKGVGYTAHKKQGPDSETTRPFSTVQMFDVNLGFSF